ncbi:hypothetical protein X975_03801, partial [Stegodyphus mimosarum]
MELIRLKKIQQNDIPKLFVYIALESASPVFLQIDRIRKQLEPPYEDPYLVINRSPKYFTLRIKNKEANVSIYRLKLAIYPTTTNPRARETYNSKLYKQCAYAN